MKSKNKCVPNGRPSPKLWQFEVSDFLRAFYTCLITLDARFLFTCSQISQQRMKTSGHNARMTKLSKTYGFWNFIIFFGLRRSRNVIWNQKKKCVLKGRPSQKLWQFEVSDFSHAFYTGLIPLDARFLFTCSQISQQHMKTSGHNARMTKLSKNYGFWNFIIFFGLRRSRNVIWNQKNNAPQKLDQAKSYGNTKFPIFYAHFTLV